MTQSIWGSQVSQQQARQRAVAFMQQRGKSIVAEPRRAPGYQSNDEWQPYYVFNTTNGQGFVIIAGDDHADAVLGYSDKGSYNEQEMNDNFRYVMELMANDMKTMSKMTDGVQILQADYHQAIAPLIQSKWNQGSGTEEGYIYNTLCPTIDGKHPVTGCTATAGAQVMYYYKHPKKPTTIVPGYIDKDTEADTSGDLPSITFDWENMKPIYASDDKGSVYERAVAELMLYCGYAAHMTYGLGGSGATIGVMVENMAKFFDYDPYTYREIIRSNYNITEWDRMVYNELACGRPVIYAGSSLTGGHAFICDGYDGEGRYHFNFGWGGGGDGYYHLYAAGNYGLGPYATIGLQPNTGTVPTEDSMYRNDDWEEEVISDRVMSANNPRTEDDHYLLNFWNLTGEEGKFKLGLGEVDSKGRIIAIDSLTWTEGVNLGNGYGWSKLKFYYTNYVLSPGKHVLYPISKLKGDKVWKKCKTDHVCFELEIVQNSVAHPVRKLVVNSMEVAANLQTGCEHPIRYTVTNEGDNIDTYIYLYVGTENETGERNYANYAKIKAGNTKEYITHHAFSEEGTYVLRLTDDSEGNNVLAEQTVSVEKGMEISQIEFKGNKLVNNDQQVDVTVVNHKSEWNSPLFLFASQTTDKGKAAGFAGMGVGAEETAIASFNFTPDQEGLWTIWICSDREGENVLAQSEVTIVPIPTEKVTLAIDRSEVSIEGNKAIVTLFVKNTTTNNVNSYREIRTWLYKNKESILFKTTPAVVIEPGATAIIQMEYDVEEGNDYEIHFNYTTTADGKNWMWLGPIVQFSVPNTTGVKAIKAASQDESVYTLEGVKVNQQPEHKGIYVKQGRKGVIK